LRAIEGAKRCASIDAGVKFKTWGIYGNSKTGLNLWYTVLAITLTVIFTKGDKVYMRLLKLLGVLISSMPLIGIIQGFIAKKRSPRYSQACFYQAITCGFGFVLVNQVLPNYI